MANLDSPSFEGDKMNVEYSGSSMLVSQSLLDQQENNEAQETKIDETHYMTLNPLKSEHNNSTMMSVRNIPHNLN